MRRLLSRARLLAYLPMALLGASLVEAQPPAAPRTDEGQWYRLADKFPTDAASFSDFRPDGTAEITMKPVAARGGENNRPTQLTEGHYIAMAAVGGVEGQRREGCVFLLIVDMVLGKDRARVRVSKAAADRLTDRHVAMLVRPVGTSQDELKTFSALPIDIDLDVEPLEVAGTPVAEADERLKQIANSLHNYHDVFGKFPPLVVIGPDGRPWHSWRVLILAFTDCAAMAGEYVLDEPWDGPNNIKLLNYMPSIYRDPTVGDEDGHFTHVVALAGDGVGIDPGRVELSEENLKRIHARGKTPKALSGLSVFTPEVRLPQIDHADGTSSTAIIGPVAAAMKIPWMKPQDITVTADVDKLDVEGGFDLRHDCDDRRQGLFLFADGSVCWLPTTLNRREFWGLATRAGGETPLALEGDGGGRFRTARVPFLVITKDQRGRPLVQMVLRREAQRVPAESGDE
jgi:hypothetical protein